MQNDNQAAIKEMLKSFAYLLDEALKKTTKTYEGIVLSATSDSRKWNVKYNNEIHAVKIYGQGTPTVNMMVKVFVPQGNQALAWFFVPGRGGGGTGDGATFYPSVSEDGVISWTNDKDLPNPDPVNIKGPQGEQGVQGEAATIRVGTVISGTVPEVTNSGTEQDAIFDFVLQQGPQGPQGSRGPQGPQGKTGPQGERGEQGDTGPYFTPSVDSSGNLSWTNNGNLTNPTTVNIKGPQGDVGPTGPQGEQGIQGIQGPAGTNGTDGENGATFTPSVNSNGDLSWTNDKGLSNPATVNIRGPQGAQGNPGPAGQNGADATVNGVNTLTIEATGGLTGTQSGNTYSISGENLPYLKTTGGTLTGNLTGRYLTGTWLQSTAVSELSSSNFKGVCVFDGSGWVYYRTKEHFLADIGAATQDYVDSAVTNAGGVKKFNGTLGPNSWTTSGNYPYQAQINISDMTAESVPNAYPQWANQSVESIEWNKLSAIESFNGYVQFYATSPFSVSIDYVIEY